MPASGLRTATAKPYRVWRDPDPRLSCNEPLFATIVLQPRPIGLLLKELVHALLAALLRIGRVGGLRLGVEILFRLVPGHRFEAASGVLDRPQDVRVLFHQ